MQLAKELAKILEEDLRDIFQGEIADPDYFPQDDFIDCRERAEAMWAAASVDAVKVLAAAIANHRMEKHKENRRVEVLEATDGLTAERIEVSERGWWIH